MYLPDWHAFQGSANNTKKTIIHPVIVATEDYPLIKLYSSGFQHEESYTATRDHVHLPRASVNLIDPAVSVITVCCWDVSIGRRFVMTGKQWMFSTELSGS